MLAIEPSLLVLKIEPVFEDSGEAGKPQMGHRRLFCLGQIAACRGAHYVL